MGSLPIALSMYRETSMGSLPIALSMYRETSMGSLPIALSMYRGDVHGFIAYSSLYVQGGRPWVHCL